MDGIAARRIRDWVTEVEESIGTAELGAATLTGAFSGTPSGPLATRLAALLAEAHELIPQLANADPEYVEAIKAADRELEEAAA